MSIIANIFQILMASNIVLASAITRVPLDRTIKIHAVVKTNNTITMDCHYKMAADVDGKMGDRSIFCPVNLLQNTPGASITLEIAEQKLHSITLRVGVPDIKFKKFENGENFVQLPLYGERKMIDVIVDINKSLGHKTLALDNAQLVLDVEVE